MCPDAISWALAYAEIISLTHLFVLFFHQCPVQTRFLAELAPAYWTAPATPSCFLSCKWFDFSAMVAAFAVLLSVGCLKALVTAIASIDVHSLVPELMARA